MMMMVNLSLCEYNSGHDCGLYIGIASLAEDLMEYCLHQ